MKKLLLILILFFSTSILVAQNFNQPAQFNTVCDDNNDGFASFWLAEISSEILGNLNWNDYVITHHETQLDASTGANALSAPYFNVSPFTQTIFVRIVTVATSEVTILTYNLNVNTTPEAPTVTVTNCADATTSFPCWDLTSVIPSIIMGTTGLTVTFFETETDAQINANLIANPVCYLSITMPPNQSPVFYRVTNDVTGCAAIGMIELVTINCENPNCPAPTQLLVDSSIPGSVTLDWAPSLGAVSYNVMYSVNGGAYLVVTAQNSSVTIPEVLCGSAYTFSVTANCGNNGTSANSDWLTFYTETCPPQPGQPINLVTCGDNVSGCFDLTINDTYVMGNLNPSEYTITYYTSEASANAGVGPIIPSTNFCGPHAQIIHARLENNTTQAYQVFPFALVVESFSNVVVQLTDMQQCDDNFDTIVTFDLTTIQAQIGTANVLEYYPSLSNAQNQVVPFTNPSALNLNVQNPITNVFVREIVAGDCDNIYSFQLHAYANCNIAYSCSQANSLCNSLGTPYQNTVNMNSIGTYGCLTTTPNPTWFYLPISQAGNFNLLIEQSTDPNVSFANLDADFVVYGPFSDPVTPCNGQLTVNNIAGCSYSANATEFVAINNAVPGQFYLLMVTNFSNQPGFIKITEVNGSTGAIDCSGLKLNAFLDSNNNGTQEMGEQNFPLGQFTYEINGNGNVHNIVSPSGMYNIYDTNASNAYDLSFAIDPNYTSSYGITTSSYSNIHVVIGGGMQVYNFPITVTQVYNDLAVTIIPINSPRPGFTYMNRIVYTNHGNQTVASGTVTYNNDPLVSIISNTQSGTTPIIDGFTYNFTNLLPFESREMTVTMQVPTIPIVNIGDLLSSSANIIPLAGDVVPVNNSSYCSQVIIGSYDPNDKMEAHGGQILHSAFTANDYLTYTIRFENSGTANAEDVRVNDVLDPKLDETTIRMISASHPYIMDRIDNNVNWNFDGIELPPSVADTNIGKGYITFQIKPRAGFAIGDIIPNTASIYFDFNPAIVTNTFNTEFVQQLGVGEFENADFAFYPNPVSDIVTIIVKNDGAIANMVVYDILGKMVVAHKPTTLQSTQTLDLSSVAKGIYLLEVTTDSNLKVIKKLIVE